MAVLVSVERSKYIEKQVEIYSKNKVGQYAKYQQKNAFFVTYFSVNQTMSRADTGTGGIESELGQFSPIRFNQIDYFPIYNLPELKPDLNYDETGIDLSIDLSGISILPNTIDPCVQDYILLKLPTQENEFLFRVNNREHNTIESNDFILVDLDIARTGKNLISEIAPQVVEHYVCIFENIGTQDKCLIKQADFEKVIEINKYIDELIDCYKSMFFLPMTGDFVVRRPVPNTSIFNGDEYYYDAYLTHFINKSDIFFKEYSNDTLVLEINDNVPFSFELQFKQTLWYAVLTKNKSLLKRWIYHCEIPNCRETSPFSMYGLQASSACLFIRTEPLIEESQPIDTGYMSLYFHDTLIEAILEGKPEIAKGSYFDEIIALYMCNQLVSLNYERILIEGFVPSIDNYHLLPIIIYIMKQLLKTYFDKKE